MSKVATFATEADLVAAFCWTIDPARWARNPAHAPKWTQYHETADWDLVLVNPDGVQIGIEAKLTLNAKVLEQCLRGAWTIPSGPDYRAILVPVGGLQHHLTTIALAIGVTVIRVAPRNGWSGDADGYTSWPQLPDEDYSHREADWPRWCPQKRLTLPDYVPDVLGGRPSPLQLSPWKIKAIKLLQILERRGYVTRADMRALGISPTRWTDHFNGYLSPGPLGYVPNNLTPDLKSQHPTAWAQIEADYETWSKGVATAGLLGLEVRS